MPGSDDLPKSDPEFAAFGRGMLEGAKAVVLAVLHAAYAVTDEARRTQLLEGVAETHRAAAVPPVDLAGLAAAVLRSAPSEASLESLTAELVREYQEAAAIRADTWGRLAEIIAGTDLKDLAWIADHDERAGQTCAFDRLAAPAGTVQALVRYLQPAGTDELISQRLFDLVASERALLPVSPLPDQTVELIQFSADTRTLLAPSRTTARSKLTGMQLRNFGAFYKRSWRANDWMWGRLDGAGWIVHVLLDPVRIREQLKKAGVPLGSRASTFLQQLETTFALSRTSAPAGIDPLGELNYLDLPDGVPPLSLPNTALWLASAWQRIIATEEVPALARAIGSAGSDWSPPNSREWASQVLSPGANPVSLLATCPVADETLETDLPSPLMRRTMAKGAATGLAAAALAPQLPKFVRPPLTSAHAIALAVHRMVSAAAGRLAFIIPIGLVLLGVGIVAAGTSSNAWGLGGVAIALSGAYLLTLAAAQSARRTLTALLSVTLVAAIVALLIPFARRWLFGTAKKNGVIASNLYWVGSDWWHPLLVLSVVGALILLAIRGVRRRRL